jgi:hypothetical protein
MPGGCDRTLRVLNSQCTEALLNSADSDKDVPGGHKS